MNNYTVGDFIIRIKNAVMARRKRVVLPYAKITKSIADVLVKEGFLTQVKEEVIEGHKALTVEIVYTNRMAVFTDVQIISKPSLRVYASLPELTNQHKKGLGTIIISTSGGIMTGKEALKKGLGGELLFKVW